MKNILRRFYAINQSLKSFSQPIMWFSIFGTQKILTRELPTEKSLKIYLTKP